MDYSKLSKEELIEIINSIDKKTSDLDNKKRQLENDYLKLYNDLKLNQALLVKKYDQLSGKISLVEELNKKRNKNKR